MQFPDSTSKRISASAADRRSHLVLLLICGLFAAAPWSAVRADIAAHEPHPFAVSDHRSGSTATYVGISGGDIGRVRPEELRAGDPSSVVALLQRHSEWTGAGPELELELWRAFERHALFRQRVHGILVDSNVKVFFDEHGHITSFSSVLVHTDAVSNLPTILKPDAIEIAKQAFRNYQGHSNASVLILPIEGWGPDIDGPTLYLVPRGLNEPVQFQWQMTVMTRTGGVTHTVLVDAHSGETSIYSNVHSSW